MSAVMPKPIVALVDGNNLLHRILHTRNLKELSTALGFPTGGVFGFLTSLRMMLERCTAGVAIVVWDGGHSPRRLTLAPDYKQRTYANEKEEAKHAAHDRLFEHQKTILEDLLPAMSARSLRIPGREADDVIAEVVRLLPEQPIVILSEDKDMLQLVGPYVSVYRPIQEALVDVAGFRAHTGVSRTFFLLRLALLGDDSDNISAVHGVGETSICRVMSIVELSCFAWGTTLDSTPLRTTTGVSGAIFSVVEELARWDARGRKRYESLLAAGPGVLEKNLELMDLSRETFHDYEREQIRASIAAPAAFNEMLVWETVNKFEFAEAIKSWHGWSGPYRRLS